jgi:glycosyltransferase involved in cell wall biosynthesis
MRLGRFSVVARSISTLSRKASLEPSFWHRRVVHAMTRAFYRRVDVVIAQSEGMKRDLISNYGIDDRQLRVIHNPLSDYFTRDRSGRPVPWQSRRNEILYVGRLNTIKGLDLLMDACLICMKADPDLVVRLLGDGEEMAALKRRAESAGVAHRVRFEGYVKDVLEYYAHARLLVLTSHYEGFPNVLLEAMAACLPVITTPAGDAAAIVRDGVTGYVVPFEDINGMAERVVSLAQSPELRRTLGEAGRKQVEHEYAYEGISDRLLSVYREVARQQRDRSLRRVVAVSQY